MSCCDYRPDGGDRPAAPGDLHRTRRVPSFHQGELRAKPGAAGDQLNVDMTFALFDAAVSETDPDRRCPSPPPATLAIPVASGVFTVALDSGTLAFNGPASSERYLRNDRQRHDPVAAHEDQRALRPAGKETAEMSARRRAAALSGTTTPTLNVISTGAGDPATSA